MQYMYNYYLRILYLNIYNTFYAHTKYCFNHYFCSSIFSDHQLHSVSTRIIFQKLVGN